MNYWQEECGEENPCSKIDLPRYIKTSEVMVCQLNHVIDNIVKLNPNYYHDKKRNNFATDRNSI